MKAKIRIDWSKIDSEAAFFREVLPLLHAPEWHGHSLNALSDSVVVGQINGVEPPYCVVMEGVERIPKSLVPFAKQVVEIWFEASRERAGIEVHFGGSHA